jgi:hypothetical protein
VRRPTRQIRAWSRWGLAAFACVGAPALAHAAAGCPSNEEHIATDRPDVTNSSIVVPAGSLQVESGVNLSSRESVRIVDGTNTRLRLGVAPCLELLIDLPAAFVAVRGHASSGFSNLTPATKWQLGPLPGDIDLSAVAGIGLPTGATRIAGRGVQPYLQMPWSRELTAGWGLSGMLTTFFTPAGPISKRTAEATFVVEKQIGERAEVFVEFVGDYPAQGGPSHLLNWGSAYRLTPKQQIDLHVGFGLDSHAPGMIFGVGYSYRFDGLP